MNGSLRMSCFDKMLRLTHPYSLLYRDMLLFILYFVIFHSQIPLLIIWYLAVACFLVYMYVINCLVSGGCMFFSLYARVFLVIIIIQKKHVNK